MPFQIPYRHLINMIQIAPNFEGVINILSKTEDVSVISSEDIIRIKRRISCAKYWLRRFAPDNVKFSVQETLPNGINLSDKEIAFLIALINRVNNCSWDDKTINSILFDTAKYSSLGLKDACESIYKITIGKTAGPKIGGLLSSMDRKFVI